MEAVRRTTDGEMRDFAKQFISPQTLWVGSVPSARPPYRFDPFDPFEP